MYIFVALFMGGAFFGFAVLSIRVIPQTDYFCNEFFATLRDFFAINENGIFVYSCISFLIAFGHGIGTKKLISLLDDDDFKDMFQ